MFEPVSEKFYLESQTVAARPAQPYLLPRHFCVADAVEILIVVHRYLDPLQLFGKCERRVVVRYRAAAIAADIEAGP